MSPKTQPVKGYVTALSRPTCGSPQVHPSGAPLHAAVSADGGATRVGCSLLIHDDDLCLHVLVAHSLEHVAAVAKTAAITPERIVAATVWLGS